MKGSADPLKLSQSFIDSLRPAPVQPVVLCPDVETIREREMARGKLGYTGFDPSDLHAAFMVETPRVGLWIDNSRQTPEETVRAILEGTEPMKQ